MTFSSRLSFPILFLSLIPTRISRRLSYVRLALVHSSRTLFESRNRACGKPFCPFHHSCVNHDCDSSSFRSNKKRRITSEPVSKIRSYTSREVKRLRSVKSKGEKKPFYLIYGVDREIVAGIADLRSVLCDRMIADRTVVAHDEAQQAYL